MKKYFPEGKATKWTRNAPITISQEETFKFPEEIFSSPGLGFGGQPWAPESSHWWKKSLCDFGVQSDAQNVQNRAEISDVLWELGFSNLMKVESENRKWQVEKLHAFHAITILDVESLV